MSDNRYSIFRFRSKMIRGRSECWVSLWFVLRLSDFPALLSKFFFYFPIVQFLKFGKNGSFATMIVVLDVCYLVCCSFIVLKIVRSLENLKISRAARYILKKKIEIGNRLVKTCNKLPAIQCTR